MKVDSEVCPSCGESFARKESQIEICPACMLELGVSEPRDDDAALPEDAAQGDSAIHNLPSARSLGSRILQFSPFPGQVPFEPPSVYSLNSQITGFEILELRGRGGMGAVYRAHHQSLNRSVAIKVLPQTLAKSPEVKERFLREARALAQLSHPNIVTIHEIGQAGDHLFFVMEYIEGGNLSELMRSGELTIPDTMRLFSEICSALIFAHGKGIIHRDIKPDNILIGEGGHVCVADFGLAKLIMEGPSSDLDLTMSQQAMGTLAYMAPEQRGKPLTVDQRSDIFSLGVVLYEMLTGEVPSGHFHPPSKLAAVDVKLDPIVLRALSAHPSDRYQSVREFQGALIEAGLNSNPEWKRAGTVARPVPRSDSGPRQVTVFFSDIVNFSGLNEKLGDREAWGVVNGILELQKEVINNEHGGEVKKFTGDSVMAIFDSPSAAMMASLEVQKKLKDECRTHDWPGVRIGLHVGEILLAQEDHVEIVSRHLNRAHRVMEMAGEGQILASKAVVDAGSDFIDTVPVEHLKISYFGEFYLKGVGAIELCEVTDDRFWKPGALQSVPADRENQSVRGRLELAGYFNAERIGEGNCGVVYKATESETGDTVAVKVLPPLAKLDRKAIGKLKSEATRIGEWKAEGLVGIRRSLIDHHPPCIVMDFVEGQPIDKALNGKSTTETAAAFLSVCSALEKAHHHGAVHGHLKPTNILLGPDLAPQVLDFGTAPITPIEGGNGSAFFGSGRTAEYLSPEQIEGKPVDSRTDIYAIGVVLYEVLSGTPPFAGDSVYSILDGHLYQDPTLPSKYNRHADDDLQRVCLKAMEKQPENRYQNLDEMMSDLKRVVDGERVRTRPLAYDNLLFNRASKHISDVNKWEEDGLLSLEEKQTILASYDGLQKRGLAAVMESRSLNPSLVAVYIGGWLAVSAAILWATLYWGDLSTVQRLTIGTSPFLFTGAVALVMHRFDHFRLLFVTLIVFIMAVPLLGYVWIYAFSIGANLTPETHLEDYELFSWNAEGELPIANLQMALIGFISLVVAAVVAWYTRTTTHAVQVAVWAPLSYTSMLLCLGLKYWLLNEEIAKASLAYLPLLFAAVFTGHALGKSKYRWRQLIPFVYLASVITSVVCITFPGFAIREWFEMDYEYSESLANLASSFFGGVAILVGFSLRRLFSFRAGYATLMVILIGATAVWVSLLLAGFAWPEDWFKISLFGATIPFPSIALPFASLAVTIVGCWRQIMSLMVLGIVELAVSLFVLAYIYFEGIQSWPALVMAVGFLWFCIALVIERRISKNHPNDNFNSGSRL